MPALPPHHPQGFTFRFDKWGPVFWRFAHAVTFLYPMQNPSKENKQVIINLFNLFAFCLPCSVCGAHFLQHLKDHPLNDEALESHDSVTRWFVDLHNVVNKGLKKPEIKYEDVYRYHMIDATRDERGNSEPEVQIYWMWVTIGVLIATVVILAILAAVMTSRAARRR